MSFYLLYTGTSPDGRGNAVYKTYTNDKAVAKHHFIQVSSDPYSTGKVEKITKTKKILITKISDI